MYAIKGAWVGQTFALASSNDSGGKKSRIRRSKAERKTMVETFINNYQKLNNGNFPSLTLTHKEVGGSFYTVREIVREIIQENKVLGPAKLSKNYTSLEQFPLGSIAIEPQTCLSPSEEIDIASPVTLNQFHTETQEDILNSNGQLNGSEHQSLLLDNEQVVNNSNVTIEEVSDFEGPVWTQSISDDQVTNAEQHLRTPEPFNIPNYQEVNNEESDAPGLDSAMPITQQEVSLEHQAETNKELHMHSEQEYAGNGYLKSGDKEVSQAPGKPNECGESIYRREVAEDNLDSAVVQTNNPKLSNGSGESIYRREVAEDNLDSAVVQTNDPEFSNGSGESIYRRDVAEDNLDSAVVQTNDPKLSNGKTGLTTDVLVEKFPLRPVSRTIHDFEVAISEQCDKPKTSAATETDCDITSSSNSLNVEDVAVLSVGDSPPESLKSISKETLVAQTSPLVGEKPVNDTERMSIGKKINTRNSGVAYGQQRPIRVGNNAGKSQLRNQHESSKKTGTSSTLNRPNLEMWEGGSSVKPAGRESNPLLALLKEFIKAIEKFFTE